MNAPPAALNQQQSAFGINELTTQLVLRLVKDDELLACGCVSKVLERAVDDARDGNILRARRHRRTKSPWHVDLAHGDDTADGTRRRPLRSDSEAIHLFINPVLNLIYTAFNGLLTFLTYEIVPFFYPDIIASIFKCNVKYLIIVFGLGILSTLWYYQDKKNGINFGLTNDILAWMTVTFVVISIFTITSQK